MSGNLPLEAGEIKLKVKRKNLVVMEKTMARRAADRRGLPRICLLLELPVLWLRLQLHETRSSTRSTMSSSGSATPAKGDLKTWRSTKNTLAKQTTISVRVG